MILGDIRHRLLVKLAESPSLPTKILNELLKKPGISTIIEFPQSSFEIEGNSLSQLVQVLKKYLLDNTDQKIINLRFKSFGQVPIHKRAILDRLKKKGFTQDSEANFHPYLEVKQLSFSEEDQKSLIIRIGKIFQKDSEIDHLDAPSLILYSPYTVQEIADFFRLALVFNTHVILTNENKQVPKVVQRVQKTFFKGISKISYQIVPSLDELLRKTTIDKFFGFSLWGINPIDNLQQMISLQKNNIGELFFVFGNEDKGLPLSVREKISMFHIGQKASEPLRASQAAAYAFGILKIG